jgi:DNA-binding MarR family transcriptional regulator
MPLSGKLDLSGTGYCASFNLRKTARAVTQVFDAALQETGMRSTQFAILVGIAKKQPVPIGALADVLIIDPTTLTRSLGLLRKEGLITISNRSTMRQRFLALTDKGERALARSLPAWRKVQEQFVSTVGAAQWNDLRNKLEKLAHTVTNLDKSSKLISAGKPTSS